MGSWDEYKKTYRTEPDLSDFARLGDFRGLVEILSQYPGIDLDAKNHRGYSALMLAAYNGEKDCCEALLRCGADVNSSDLMGNSVLMASAFKGNLEIVKLLLQYGAVITHKNQTNMNTRDWALMFGRTEVVKYLDDIYPDNTPSSKLTSIIRFIKLSLVMIRLKITPHKPKIAS